MTSGRYAAQDAGSEVIGAQGIILFVRNMIHFSDIVNSCPKHATFFGRGSQHLPNAALLISKMRSLACAVSAGDRHHNVVRRISFWPIPFRVDSGEQIGDRTSCERPCWSPARGSRVSRHAFPDRHARSPTLRGHASGDPLCEANHPRGGHALPRESGTPKAPLSRTCPRARDR